MAKTLKQSLKLKVLATAIVPMVGLWAAERAMAADEAIQVAQASTSKQETKKTKDQQARASRDVRASELIGMEVHDGKGEKLGEVKELIIDVNSQSVHYAVLGFGGVLGLGEKLFAYPVQDFRFGPERDELVLNVDKERLKDAPGFEESRWPDWSRSDDPYRADVDRYHNKNRTQQAAAAKPGQRLARASELIGDEIEDQRGQNAGEIKDLVVNLDNGKVRYAVVELDRDWGMDDKLMPMPLASFLFPAESDRKPVLNMSKDRLDSSLAFSGDRWPDINDPKYRRDVDRYIGGAPRGVAGRAGDEESRARREAREGAREMREEGRELRNETREGARELRNETREETRELRNETR